MCSGPYRDLHKAALLFIYLINSKSQGFQQSSARVIGEHGDGWARGQREQHITGGT